MPAKIRQHGFTLIEILIALAIFAIMATITSVTLSNIFRTRDQVQTHANHLADLQFGYHLLAQDLSHSVALPMYNFNNRPLGSFLGELKQFTLSRDHFFAADKAELSGQIQRIRYVFSDQQLFRQLLDKHNKIINQTVLLKNIDSLKLSYLQKKKYWREKWQDWRNNSLPSAVLIKIKFKQLGRLELLFRIPHGEITKFAKAD